MAWDEHDIKIHKDTMYMTPEQKNKYLLDSYNKIPSVKARKAAEAKEAKATAKTQRTEQFAQEHPKLHQIGQQFKNIVNKVGSAINSASHESF